MILRHAAATLAAVLALAAPQAARAQHACPGHVSATALGPVPAGARYGFALRDDGPAQRQLRDSMAAVMRRAGLAVADPPTHLLSWRGGQSGAGGGRGGTDMLLARRDSFQESDDLSWMRDVPRTGRAGGFGGVRISGSVELREVASGRVVWTAVLSCERQGGDQAALASALALAVVPVIGQTVSGRPF